MLRLLGVYYFVVLLTTSCGFDFAFRPALELKPSILVGMRLVDPDSSPSLNLSPTMRVLDVQTGALVKIFSDPSCHNLVGEGTANSSELDITLGTSLAIGVNALYATQTVNGVSSECSEKLLDYITLSCPANYIPVPHDNSLGTSKDFCVMKYEAKNNGSGGAISHPDNKAFVSVSISDASNKCSALGADYDLISNQEWMTIARDIESVADNFSSNILSRGWTASSSLGDSWTNTSLAVTSDSACEFNTGVNTCGSTGNHLFKRTHKLSNGEQIWDFSGNAWEWIDWSESTPGLQFGPTTCTAGWVELSAVNAFSCYISGDITASEVLPSNAGADSTLGYGRFYGGSSGGAVRRGGAFARGAQSGVFAVGFDYSGTAQSNVGFRCVYRP